MMLGGVYGQPGASFRDGKGYASMLFVSDCDAGHYGGKSSFRTLTVENIAALESDGEISSIVWAPTSP